MLSGSDFRELVSNRRRGLAPSLLRAVLRAAETPYTMAVGWRNRRYDRGHAVAHRVGVPVISVGNLTLGGTGKTPMVQWVARWLREREVCVAIVSRGYRAEANGHNDEALELRQALSKVPHAQNPDRLAAAEQVLAEFNCQVILLDDGFQHRRLARDLDIVLLDALEPFGYEHVFPRGMLREPVAGLQRADVVCLSRADTITAAERDTIRWRVSELAPRAAWCELCHAPSELLNSSGAREPLAALREQRVAAFCGIGNPAGFRHTLSGLGCQVVAWRAFPDHHAYSGDDLAQLDQMAAAATADIVLCTHKDLVKVRQERLGDRPLWALCVEMQFLAGREVMELRLKSILQRRVS